MDWDATAIGTVVSAVFAGASAIFAGLSTRISARAITVQQRAQASEVILQQAEMSLQWAWDALTEDGTHVSPPQPNRLNWLTAARHILRYKELKAEVTEPAHRTICEDREEFWRHRFYLCLDCKAFLQGSYFQVENIQQSGLEKTSVAVVFAFSKWPEGKDDLINKVDVAQLITEAKLLNGKPGLANFLTSTGA